MRNVLKINGSQIPGISEPKKKAYQLDYHTAENFAIIEQFIRKNPKSVKEWQQSDMPLNRLFPVNEAIDHRSITECPTQVLEWMYNTRILDIAHNAGKPGIQIKLPQYVSVRPNWIIALNTFIQAVDGGIADSVDTITRVLNNKKLWKNMNYDKAVDRERLHMLRWLLWQLLKAK